jgi:hypothetical protein
MSRRELSPVEQRKNLPDRPGELAQHIDPRYRERRFDAAHHPAAMSDPIWRM